MVISLVSKSTAQLHARRPQSKQRRNRYLPLNSNIVLFNQVLVFLQVFRLHNFTLCRYSSFLLLELRNILKCLCKYLYQWPLVPLDLLVVIDLILPEPSFNPLLHIGLLISTHFLALLCYSRPGFPQEFGKVVIPIQGVGCLLKCRRFCGRRSVRVPHWSSRRSIGHRLRYLCNKILTLCIVFSSLSLQVGSRCLIVPTYYFANSDPSDV